MKLRQIKMKNITPKKERVFSIELTSKANLKTVTLTNGDSDNALIEGTIGELMQAAFTEGVILEVAGKTGVLRIDLREDEITKTPEQNQTEGGKPMNKALIVYGTRYGAAASTSEEIAKILRQDGMETRVVNAKQEKIRDVTDYSLIVVGSGIQINKWTSEPEKFLKKFQKELATKQVAQFVCCGSASQATTTPPDDAAKAKTKYLDAKAVQYHLQPVALGFFGGVYNYNKTSWWAKKPWTQTDSEWKPRTSKQNPAYTTPATGTLSETGRNTSPTPPTLNLNSQIFLQLPVYPRNFMGLV